MACGRPYIARIWLFHPSDEFVVDDIDEPEADLLLKSTVCDRDFLHFFIVADVVLHDLPGKFASFLEFFPFEKEPVKVEALFLLLDYFDS